MVLEVLSERDLDEVYGFADARLKAAVPDETERMFLSWDVKWRREALTHYLRTGWCFIGRDEKGVAGFILAQPFLFFRGQTQTLWVEHIEARDESITAQLVEVAVKVAREKHLQRVLFADGDKLPLGAWKHERLSDAIAEIKTTKG